MIIVRFSRKGVRLKLWQGWGQGTSSGGTFQCHWQEAEDKIVLLSEAIASSVFMNTKVSHYMHATWVHSYTRTHTGGRVCVCVRVKLCILWSLVHPYNCISVSAHGLGVFLPPTAAANTAPPCCAHGFELESVCQAPLRGLAALETPATKVRCLFLPSLMLQHEPQAILQREPLGGERKKVNIGLTRELTQPLLCCGPGWSPLQADFELTTLFPSAQAPSWERKWELHSPLGSQGYVGPWLPESCFSLQGERGRSISGFLPPFFLPPLLCPSPLLLLYLTSLPLLPSHRSKWVPGHTGSVLHWLCDLVTVGKWV